MIVRYKKGNRWKSSTKEYQYRRWRKNVFELNKRTKGLSKYYEYVIKEFAKTSSIEEQLDQIEDEEVYDELLDDIDLDTIH